MLNAETTALNDLADIAMAAAAFSLSHLNLTPLNERGVDCPLSGIGAAGKEGGNSALRRAFHPKIGGAQYRGRRLIRNLI